MDFSFLKKDNWIDELPKQQFIVLDRNSIEDFVAETNKDLEKGHFGHFTKKVVALVFLTKSEILTHKDFKDVFTPRKIRKDLIEAFQKALINIQTTLREKLNQPDCADYFLKLINFSILWKKILAEEDRLIAEFVSKKITVREVLNLVSKCYWSIDSVPIPQEDLTDNSEKFLFPEKVADAASHLLHLLAASRKIKTENLYDFKHSANDSDLYALIIGFLKIKIIRDYEPMIVRMDYELEFENNLFSFKTNNEDLNFGIDAGYLKDWWGGLRDRRMFEKEVGDKKESLEDYFEKFYERFGEMCWKVNREQVPRLILTIPDICLEWMAKNIFLSDWIAREEVIALAVGSKEICITPEEILNKEIESGFDFRKLIKITRAFKFLSHSLKKRLDELTSLESDVFENTLFFTWKKETILSFFKNVGLSENDMNAFLRVMTNDLLESDFLDLTYSPILKIGDLYCCVFALMDHYRIPRSVMYAPKNNLRFYKDGEKDPVTETLANNFRKITPYVTEGFKYSWNGQKGEIDLIAYYDGCLFVFEGKNTLIPYGSMEMRTMIDHLNKAVDQLSRARGAFNDPTKKAEIIRRIGWEKILSECKETSFCILICNRLMTGINYLDFPVMYVHELGNILTEGEYRVHLTDGNILKMKIWKGEKVTGVDIKEFINGGSYHQVMKNNIKQERDRFSVGDIHIETDNYKFDEKKYLKDVETLMTKESGGTR